MIGHMRKSFLPLAVFLVLALPSQAEAAETRTRCAKSPTGWRAIVRTNEASGKFSCKKVRRLERDVNRHLRWADEQGNAELEGWYFNVRSQGRLWGCKVWPRKAWCQVEGDDAEWHLPHVLWKKVKS